METHLKTRVILLCAGVAALAAVPLALPDGLVNAAISMLIAALFACAYNLLCGHAGMLSFGHSAYFGVGAFATIHAMNALGGTGLLPTPWMPLIGAAGGLLAGLAAGWFSTQRTGAYFAMITLAIAELLHALAPQLRSVFGGEAGISSMRMPAWGLSFGSIAEVYYLTLAWVLASLALLYLLTRTPLGRLALGLRENGHRLRFLGYDVHCIGVLVFALSGMFSGIAGGLQVLSNESANYVVFDTSLSAAVVLNTYIGGVHAFLGPALGAALVTFFGYAVSDLTQSWLLYQGALFVLVIMFMPTGLAGLLELAGGFAKRYGLRAVAPAAGLYLLAGAGCAAAAVFLTELLQRLFSQDYRSLARAAGAWEWPAIALFGREWSPTGVLTWLVPAALAALGWLCWRAASAAAGRLRDAAPAQQDPLAGAMAERRPT
ncbi:branched-chain amino acid ABC transporter permease [Castellaniella defragrans]|uniref:Branched-chain amino acid transport system permease protein n=1 Tax=Castellaniella defragrans TaxID=75697 RepID=A0A7W9WP30_CASDE|nr:branched-chain amino acid ABC transporter permease [Castellaniella defragrans]KAB0619932.1 branched-chain amino acid ABC transporter permease [Castellaniella defragrans]MBB6084168.1 branched-chain amino acid transport system permease protein [Castellaniella defragrans]